MGATSDLVASYAQTVRQQRDEIAALVAQQLLLQAEMGQLRAAIDTSGKLLAEMWQLYREEYNRRDRLETLLRIQATAARPSAESNGEATKHPGPYGDS